MRHSVTRGSRDGHAPSRASHCCTRPPLFAVPWVLPAAFSRSDMVLSSLSSDLFSLFSPFFFFSAFLSTLRFLRPLRPQLGFLRWRLQCSARASGQRLRWLRTVLAAGEGPRAPRRRRARPSCGPRRRARARARARCMSGGASATPRAGSAGCRSARACSARSAAFPAPCNARKAAWRNSHRCTRRAREGGILTDARAAAHPRWPLFDAVVAG